MEEFQGIDIVRYLNGWDIEGEGIVDNLAQIVGRDILAKETVGHTICYLLEGHILNVVKKLLRKRTDICGHV
jgi:hypothetical protein